MTIDMWFPTAVYDELLYPSDTIHQGMVDYVDQFNKQHPTTYSITGDTVNEYQISSKSEFSWLNKQVATHCYKYLEEYGLNTKYLDLFASKSWPVVCNPKKITGEDSVVIQKHNHMNAHVSAIYYLQTEEDKGGELKLHISPTHPLNYVPLSPYVETVRYLTLDSVQYTPVKNKLIIFPSSVFHEVNLYYGTTARYSITYDITITGKKDLNTDNEMCVINPSNWMELVPNG